MGLDEIRNDLKLAREYLYTQRTKVVAVKNQIILGEEQGTGIEPLLELTKRVGNKLKASTVADWVIGHAAAVVLIEAGVAGVYGGTLSEEAEKRLQEAGVIVEGGIRVPYILRRDKAGRCPMDETIYNVPDNQKAIRVLFEFLKKKKG